MRLLLIKMSSLGDVIHTLPALTEAKKHIPSLECDWVVEPAFSEIPTWHPAVSRVIPIPLRAWRRQFLKTLFSTAWIKTFKMLREKHYDVIIDAQGLSKSAAIACLAKGTRFGFDKTSAREPWVHVAYHHPVSIEKNQHAILRLKQLFAHVFDYQTDETQIDYGLHVDRFDVASTRKKTDVMFLHGTTWATKHWPLSYWVALAKYTESRGFSVQIPWGNDEEKQRAETIAANGQHISVLPKLNLTALAAHLVQTKTVIAVDTGLAHLAAALNVPTVSLYGPTNPALTGTRGKHQIHLTADFSCSPCLQKVCHYQGASSVSPACFATIPLEPLYQQLDLLISE